MSFTASALIVSWAAILLLGFALAGVLARLHRLEQALAGPVAAPTPAGAQLILQPPVCQTEFSTLTIRGIRDQSGVELIELTRHIQNKRSASLIVRSPDSR